METSVSKEGVLSIGGVSVQKLAEECGTPLYVYDEAEIEAKMQAFAENFSGFGFHTQVFYACKAFCCKAMVKLAAGCGLGLDTVSSGEIYTALQAGVNPAAILMHGNNKSEKELRLAFEAGIGRLVLDNEMEAAELVRLAREYPEKKMKVLLRVNPGIDAHTHKYIQTAYIDSKFGISILQMEEIAGIVKMVQSAGNLAFSGFHAHIGSQIFEKEAFEKEVETMCRFIAAFEKETGMQIRELDLGGGFAARYTDADAPIPVKEVCTNILSWCRKSVDACHLSVDTILIEPGRSIAAEAGYQLYTVGYMKQTQNKQYIFIDGGMTDNIRPALYQAAYDFDVATNMHAEKNRKVTIAGKCCESGDILGEDVWLQPCSSGDLLIVHTTGAYGWSMSSRYNKLLNPGVVFVKDGQFRWVVRPESLEDMLAREVD